jgi:hypothetical protein
LHHCEIETGKDSTKEKPDDVVAAERLPGNAPIHQRYGDLLVLAFAQEVWPQFGFHDEDERGIQGSDGFARCPAPVEREIENALDLVAKDLAR